MATPRVWCLNLDAELELAQPGYRTRSASMQARLAALRPRLSGLLGPGDLVLDDDPSPKAIFGLEGAAWCPTPWALSLLQKAGARLPEAPPFATLRRANHRRFCAGLGHHLPGACYVDTLDELRAAVAAPTGSGSWLLKRPLGFAGRGQLRASAGPLDEATRRWAEAALRGGEGLQVEPLVERFGDFAIHGLLGRDGALRLGHPTVQRCSALGSWESSERADGELLDGERRALEEEARRVAEALEKIGYFGPFNLDAFAWKGDDGGRRFNPRCEINARYSMGWAVGLGGAVSAGP